MKTNLIFKRQETVNGEIKVVTKIVPVDIPFINSGEGWLLSGHTDTIEIMSTEQFEMAPIVTHSTPVENARHVEKNKIITDNEKFNSNVQGTAKLVRAKGVIKIVSRRGKSTYNQTTPNSVCINDFTKNEFFKNCREVHGQNSGIFQFKESDGRSYDYWNDVIDKEYIRQKNSVSNSI